MAKRSLYRHTPNWFPTLLALQDYGTQHTMWQYSGTICGNNTLKIFPGTTGLILTKLCMKHQRHTCDFSLFRRELPIFCLFLRKSPYEHFQTFLFILNISLFGISDLLTEIQEFPSSITCLIRDLSLLYFVHTCFMTLG